MVFIGDYLVGILQYRIQMEEGVLGLQKDLLRVGERPEPANLPTQIKEYCYVNHTRRV